MTTTKKNKNFIILSPESLNYFYYPSLVSKQRKKYERDTTMHKHHFQINAHPSQNITQQSHILLNQTPHNNIEKITSIIIVIVNLRIVSREQYSVGRVLIMSYRVWFHNRGSLLTHHLITKPTLHGQLLWHTLSITPIRTPSPNQCLLSLTLPPLNGYSSTRGTAFPSNPRTSED
ncbi:unnamed protein product [Trypanosoma congolense IL3000]|uniref:WGS project CAEQ00000000 data, annotated contig 182 n=1 Tax=Trypanosoma congolense (strain IL3000) TaxID=1068625 RepID=F9W956_TRYCI|nr:unnamed protein product [Trypanosoma congolense IL3000]